MNESKYTWDYFGLMLCELCDCMVRSIVCNACESSERCEYCGECAECGEIEPTI